MYTFGEKLGEQMGISTARIHTLQKYATTRTPSLENLSELGQTNIAVLSDWSSCEGELRVGNKGNFYLLHKAQGIFWIFQAVINAFKKWWYDRASETPEAYQNRFSVAIRGNIQVLFVRDVLKVIGDVVGFYNVASNIIEGHSQAVQEAQKASWGKFLRLIDKLEASGSLQWDITKLSPAPFVVGTITTNAVDEVAHLRTLVGRYVLKPNGDLHDFWVEDDDFYAKA